MLYISEIASIATVFAKKIQGAMRRQRKGATLKYWESRLQYVCGSD